MTDPVVREIRDLVNRALLPLKAVDAGLYHRAVDYVVDGARRLRAEGPSGGRGTWDEPAGGRRRHS